MTFNKYFLALLTLLSIQQPALPSHSANDEINVIFDFDGVTCQTNSTSMGWHTGIRNFINYILAGNGIRGISHTIRTRLFEFLDLVQPQDLEQILAYDSEGNVLPQLMCNVLSGKTSMKQALYLIEVTAQKHKHFFKNKSERRLILAITKIMFTPEKFIKTRALIRSTIKFIKYCKKKGYKIYALSNWDSESGALLKNEFKLDKYFDDIMLSGDVGYIKPDSAIYLELLEKHNLNPENCLFFDDRPENIEAAHALGINAVLYDKKCTVDDMYFALDEMEFSKKVYANFDADYGVEFI